MRAHSSGRVGCCQIWLQRPAIEPVPRDAGETGDDVGGLPAPAPASTSSESAARLRPRRPRPQGDSPITSVISPFGGSPNLGATSAAVPRTTSSKRFVSSRQTATGRSGHTAASEARVAGSLFGDSKATAAYGQRPSSSQSAARAFSAAAGSRGTGTAPRRGRSRRAPSPPPEAQEHGHGDPRLERRRDQPAPGSLTPGDPRRSSMRPARPLRAAAAPGPCARPRCARDS